MIPEQPVSSPQLPEPRPPIIQPPKSRKWLYVAIALLIIVILLGGALIYLLTKPAVKQSAFTSKPTISPAAMGQLQVDFSKAYGDKYSNGLLPVGDGRYATDAAKQGYVYTCSQYAHNLTTDQGGAGSRGPWFTANNTEYDVHKKVKVQGGVNWKGSFSNVVNGGTRTITTNDLPLSHTTGVFPIASSDPAYAYDRNPNAIKAQSLTYNLNASPTYGSPQCMGGEAGVMLSGVALFNAFDAGGRDAGAWEVQDSCNGHPQVDGEYHYHTLSSCLSDISVRSVLGFALDGFPITGAEVSPGNILTTSDLDECHGITSPVTLDGKQVTMYHYVMTEDFPYSVSCFRSSAIQPPGMKGPQPPGV